jgi:hypothetical protein
MSIAGPGQQIPRLTNEEARAAEKSITLVEEHVKDLVTGSIDGTAADQAALLHSVVEAMNWVLGQRRILAMSRPSMVQPVPASVMLKE